MMRKNPKRESVLVRLACGFFAMATCAHSQSANVYWTGAVSNEWENGLNWDNGTGPGEGDRAYLTAGSVVDYSDAPENDGSTNYRGVIQNGGVLNITGGELKATELASATSNFDGTVNHTGGNAAYNAVLTGTSNGTSGTYLLSGGELRVARGSGGYSLKLGGLSSTGTGRLSISGGSFLTRDSVKLGDATNAGTGTFEVVGSGFPRSVWGRRMTTLTRRGNSMRVRR